MGDEFGTDENDLVKTPIGQLNLKTAKAIYFNGGRMTFGAKARQSRFYQKSFIEHSAMDIFNNNKRCCDDPVIINIGGLRKFQTFDQKTVSEGLFMLFI